MSIYLDLFWTFFRIGLFTFGGGLAMLPLLEKEVVATKHWATYDELVDYYAIGQCTPGIIAVNTATFVGYSQKKISGAIVATAGIICPSLIIIILIASLMTSFADQPLVQHALAGIRIAVCVLIGQAVIRLFKKGVKDIFGMVLFLVILLATYFNWIPVALAVVLAAVAGIAYCLLVKKQTGKDPAAKEAKKEARKEEKRKEEAKEQEQESNSFTPLSKTNAFASASQESNSTSSSHALPADSKESENLSKSKEIQASASGQDKVQSDADEIRAQDSSISNPSALENDIQKPENTPQPKAVSSDTKADENPAHLPDSARFNPDLNSSGGKKDA